MRKTVRMADLTIGDAIIVKEWGEVWGVFFIDTEKYEMGIWNGEYQVSQIKYSPDWSIEIADKKLSPPAWLLTDKMELAQVILKWRVR